MQLYQVVPLDEPRLVVKECGYQLARFRELVGRDPDHIDSHQHVHREGPAAEAAALLAGGLGVPLRHARPGVRYCGGFYAQTERGHPYPDGVSVETLTAIIAGLQSGATELACHPGEDDGLDTMYRSERELEIRTLCDPRIREALRDAGATLLTFRDVTLSGGLKPGTATPPWPEPETTALTQTRAAPNPGSKTP